MFSSKWQLQKETNYVIQMGQVFPSKTWNGDISYVNRVWYVWSNVFVTAVNPARVSLLSLKNETKQSSSDDTGTHDGGMISADVKITTSTHLTYISVYII